MKASPLLDRYKGIVDVSLIEQIYEVAHALADLRVVYVNTTAEGSGRCRKKTPRAAQPCDDIEAQLCYSSSEKKEAIK